MKHNALYLNNNMLFTFLRIDQIDLLSKQFNKLVTTPKTFKDLCRSIKLEERLKSLVEDKTIQLKDIKVYSDEFKIFMDLSSYKYFSDNEAMLMAMSKANDGVILVDKLSDLKEYLDKFEIDFVTLEDIFTNAIDDNIIGKDEAISILNKISASKTPISLDTLDDIKNKLKNY